MATSRELAGPTPNGGERATVFFQDEHGAPAEEAEATKAEIVEYDSTGKTISRTYGELNPK